MNDASFFRALGAFVCSPVIGFFLMIVSFAAFSQTWQTFTLEQCITTALEKSTALTVAKEKIVESSAKLKETKTYFLPKLTTSVFVSKLDEPAYLDMTKWFDAMGGLATPVGWLAWKDFSATGDTAAWNAFQRWQTQTSGGNTKYTLGGDMVFNGSLTLVQPLFMGFRIVNGRKAAENVLKAVKENEVKTRRDIILDVKKLFFSILQTQQLVVVCDTAIRQLEGIVRDLENMKETGIVGDQEVMNASVWLYNVQLMKVKAENGVILTKSALCNAMGIDWNTPIILNHALAEPAGPGVTDLPSLVDKAQATQSEIKALEYQREALKNMVAYTRSNYYPALFAMGNCNLKRPNRQYKDEFYTSWDISLGLKMNIFDWGETRQKVSQAKSQMLQVDGGLTQLKSGMAFLVEKHYLAIVEAFKRIDLNKKAMEKAQLSYTITHDKFQVGMAKNADLLEAQRVLTTAKIDFYNGVAAFYVAHAELEHLLEK